MSSQDKILYKGKNPKDEENRRFSAPKGVHPFIAATILILVTVVLSTIVASFVSNVSSERSKVILNATQTKLSCQYAGFLVTNVTYDCNSGCFTGSPYRINATIENTGSSRVIASNLFITLTDGTSYRIDGNISSLSAGDITTKLFDAIRINTTTTNDADPTETMSTTDAYVNGTNTIGLWHFDDGAGNTTNDSSRANTGTLYNGSTVCNNSTNQCPQWNASGKFGSAITFDGINDYVLLDARNFSNVSGTLETWINMQNNNPSNNYTIFSTPSEISNTHGGLVGLWHFSQNSTASGGVKDSSPYGNNGTATGGPIFTNEGRFQTAWNFDGINDFVSIPDNPSTSPTVITVSGWLKTSSTGSITFASKRSGGAGTYSWAVTAVGLDNKFNGMFVSGSGSDWTLCSAVGDGLGPVLNDNVWHHLAGVYDGTKCTVYIDSTAIASGGSAGSIFDSASVVEIGSEGGGATNFFNGPIDEVAIYNRSLSAAEVRDIYLGGLSLHKQGDDLRFVAGNTTLTYNFSGRSGWYHVAGTYNSSNATLYVNGSSVNASSNRGLVIFGNNSFVGGINSTTFNQSFNGTIDELRISNISRSFNASTASLTLQYNITLINISAVRVYNRTNALINTSTGLGGVNRYNKTLIGLTNSSEYRVEVDTSDGVTMEKWYPYRTGGACAATSTLDKVTFASTNCPEVTDTYPGTDVTFANCV